MRKLYYENCMLREFTATVTGCEKSEKGWKVTLNATAFYPEGGGQACDLGTLDGVAVTDVREEGEAVIHLCDAPLEEGKTVTGIIDWQRRFDLMQQHTGEHILSGLINGKFGWHNVGFHVGKDVMEVDFDGPISAEEVQWLEEQANRAIWEDLPIRCFVPDEEELEKTVYRSKRRLPWPVRIVQVPGIDSCACCGVHTATTGQVGLIKILSCTKFHSGVRLEMVCGSRAYRYTAAVFEQNRQISQLLSAKPLETAQAVAKLSQTLSEEKLRSANLQKQVFDGVAENYVNQEDVVHFEGKLSGGDLRLLTEKIAAKCRGFAAVFAGEDGTYSYCLGCPGGDLRQLGKDLNQTLNGRGGGKPDFQQGSVAASRQAILDFFADFQR